MIKTKHIYLTLLTILMLSVCFAVLAFAAEEVVIAEKSKNFVLPIVISETAPETDKTAAEKLCYYIEEITGLKPELITNYSSPAIYIGSASAINTSALPNEAYTVKALNGSVHIAGAGSRGTIYGVYGFLREYCGCRWFAENDIRTPENTAIKIPANTEKTVEQYFEYRESDWINSTTKEYSLAHNLNGNSFRRFSAAEGGNAGYIGSFAHTLTARYCSKDKYFESNPEYFAFVDGKRQDTQLCLSNEDVYNIVLNEVISDIKNNLNPSMGLQIISLTQADNEEYCECDSCNALLEKYGTQSGIMLHFVNRIAEEVEKAGYDTIAIDTFAYRYTRSLPKNIAPRDNVIIRLCSIECCFCHTLDDKSCKENVSFMHDLKEWNKICKRLYIWDYTCNYNSSTAVFANFKVLQRNLQIFAENNVKGVYEEGMYYARNVNVEFAEVREYLIAELLRDPYINYEEALDECFEAYYGEAGKYIKEFIYYLCDEEAENDHLGIYDCSVTELYQSLSKKEIRYLDSLWDLAYAANGTQEQKMHVDRSQISWETWKADNRVGIYSVLRGRIPIGDAMEALYNRLLSYDVAVINEGGGKICDDMWFIRLNTPYLWTVQSSEHPTNILNTKNAETLLDFFFPILYIINFFMNVFNLI